ncbi:MAG TPA: tetratricopeptide repeat protein [Chthonomonadaceae bacterium]|nr:tetratricopeptide repeat protein [Chthonomonadaceae bacterium]
MDTPWHIALLGQFSARQDTRSITRFRTQKTGALLAYLAYYRDRAHPREELIGLFWPEDAPEAGRNSLRVALTSLRRQLEPPGVPAGAVLRADRLNVQLNPAACLTDVTEFEASLQAASEAESAAARALFLRQAAELYRGDLLPGHYEEWILPERDHLQATYLSALRQLVKLLARTREFDQAIAFTRRALSADPLREELHRNLMRLYAAIGQPFAALEHYAELERLLRAEVGAAPAPATRELAEQLSHAVPAPLPEGETAPLEDAPHPPAGRDLASLRTTPQAGPAETGPPADTDSVPARGALPMQFNPFFGREPEIARLLELLSPSHSLRNRDHPREAGSPPPLLTLTGPGGNGKTRLAVQAAQRLRDSFPGGVWFVALADLTHPRQILSAIADTLRLPRRPDAEPLEPVVAALSAQPALLILDNFEHLAAGGGAVVLSLLKRIPTLTCLVTSRRRLKLVGEREFPVRPLPAPQGEQTPERLAQVASVQLFVDRAQAARPDFQITPRNAADIAALCRRLEGIPLAIELAAARAQVFSPAQMLARLEQRFDLLVARTGDKASRHRSLWAAISWSYGLLPPPLQRFFARLSVFRGGWSLEAAETVCEEPHAVDYLSQLQGHSLVFAEEGAPEMRFRMLETLREYAEEQLPAEERTALARRHAACFAALAERADPEINGPEQGVWLDRLASDYGNLQAALERCQNLPGGIEIGLQAASHLWQFWTIRGPVHEAREQLAALLERMEDSVPAPLRAKVLCVAGNLADIEGDLRAAQILGEQSLALYRALGNEHGCALQLNNLAILADQSGDYDRARALGEEALALHRRIGDPASVARALCNLGVIARHQADYARARALAEDALEIYRQMEDHRKAAIVLHNLGVVASDLRDDAQASRCLEESLAIRRQLDDRRGVAVSLGFLAQLACKQEDYALACAQYQESLRIFREMGDSARALRCLDGLAGVLIPLGRPGRAARLLAVVETQRPLLDAAWTPQEREELAQALVAARGALGETKFERAYAQGQCMTPEQAFELALEPVN